MRLPGAGRKEHVIGSALEQRNRNRHVGAVLRLEVRILPVLVGNVPPDEHFSDMAERGEIAAIEQLVKGLVGLRIEVVVTRDFAVQEQQAPTYAFVASLVAWKEVQQPIKQPRSEARLRIEV